MSVVSDHDPLRRKAVFQLVLATAAWGLSFPLFTMLFQVQRERVADAPSFLAAHAIGTRALAAAAIFLALRPMLLRGLTRREWRQGTLLGLFGGAGLILQADGLHYTSAPVSAFLTQFYCVLLPLWFCVRRREWLPPRLLAATLLVMAGIALLSGLCRIERGGLAFESIGLGRGEIETLLSTLFFTVQILLLDRPGWKANRMVPVTVVMFLGFAVCAAPVVYVAMPRASAVLAIYAGAEEALIMLAIVLFCTVFAYTAMNRWQPHVSATEGGLIYCLEPVFTTGYALFLPAWLAAWTGVAYANDRLTPAIIVGGGLITAANAILQLPARRTSHDLANQAAPL